MGIRSRLAKALALPPGATALTEQQVAGLTPQTANSSNMATPLPRESTDATVPFAPAMPLYPSLINTPRADGRAEPRKSEFPVAWNIQILEQRNVPFRVLREVADGADIIRKCVEVVKATVAGMVWDISINEDAIARVMTEQNITNTAAAKQVRDQYQTEITAAKDFWRSPDRMNGMSFQEWLMMLLEEVMVVDALTIYPNRTADSKNLHSLEILDGTTIKPLLNARGSRPLPPHPAFQQILWGFPRGEFTAAPDADGEFTADDLVYAPRVRRPFTPYGLSPVERCLPLVDLYMKRLQWFRTEFTDGAIPDMMMKSDMEFGNNPELLRGYEQVFNDALGGSMEQRRRMRLLPNGFDPVFSPSSDSKFNSDFDDFIVKSICGHFGVLPTQIGFTPKAGLGGAGHQAGEAASAETLGLRPIITWVSDLLNQLSHRFVGMPQDLQFVFSDGTENDEMAQATRRQTEIFSGQKTWNEIRSEAGLPLFDFPEADAPIIVSGATIVPLSGTFEQVAVDAALQDTDAPDATVADTETSDEAALELAKFVKWARTEKSRPFHFAAVPHSVAESLNALVQVDSEAARDYAMSLRKAGDARPKVRGGREPFPANHPARAVSDRLNEIYTEKLFSLGNVDAHRLVTDWLSSSDNDAAAWLRAKETTVFRPGLKQVLNDLYAESAWMGDRAAAALVAGARERMKAVSATVDWDGWTPGDPAKAAVLLGTYGTGSGLRDLLAQSNVTIAGITGTRLDLIGTILSDAMGRGQGVTGTAKEIADAMNTIVTESVERINGTAMSRERAEMIAHTEMTRAGNAAATDHYRSQGVSEVEWQTSNDAGVCEECSGHEADSPFPMDSAPQPPEHPWCGCQLLPVAFDNDDTFQYSPEEEAEMAAMDQAAADHPNVEPDSPEAHANVSDQPELATASEVAELAKDGWVEGRWERADLEAHKQGLRDEWNLRNPPPQPSTYPNVTQFRLDKHQALLNKFEATLKRIKGIYDNGSLRVTDQFGLKPARMEEALRNIDLARKVSEASASGAVDVKIMMDSDFNVKGKGASGLCWQTSKADGVSRVWVRGKDYNGQSIAQTYKAEPGSRTFDTIQHHYSNNIETTPLSEHVMVHEYGHAVDRAPIDSQMFTDRQDLFDKYKGTEVGRNRYVDSQLPSGYAATSPAEAYAESFAQWTVTRGMTSNAVVQEYARTFGWRKP